MFAQANHRVTQREERNELQKRGHVAACPGTDHPTVHSLTIIPFVWPGSTDAICTPSSVGMQSALPGPGHGPAPDCIDFACSHNRINPMAYVDALVHKPRLSLRYVPGVPNLGHHLRGSTDPCNQMLTCGKGLQRFGTCSIHNNPTHTTKIQSVKLNNEIHMIYGDHLHRSTPYGTYLIWPQFQSRRAKPYFPLPLLCVALSSTLRRR